MHEKGCTFPYFTGSVAVNISLGKAAPNLSGHLASKEQGGQQGFLGASSSLETR